MADREAAGLVNASAGSAARLAGGPPTHDSPERFERAKRNLLLACGAIGVGLAVAGSVDQATGGVLLLVGWLGGVYALHRLGRTGSDRGAPGNPAP